MTISLAIQVSPMILGRTQLGAKTALCDLVDDASDDLAPPLLAQLISDRCRELGELTAAYRRALSSADRNGDRDEFDPPF